MADLGVRQVAQASVKRRPKVARRWAENTFESRAQVTSMEDGEVVLGKREELRSRAVVEVASEKRARSNGEIGRAVV